MKIITNCKTAMGAAIALALTTSFATEVSAQQLRSNARVPQTLGLTTNSGGGNTAQVDEHCNNVASCNIMIAYCIGNGGDFEVEGSSGTGQPSKGTCHY